MVIFSRCWGLILITQLHNYTITQNYANELRGIKRAADSAA